MIGDIGWNSSIIISWPISVGFPLSVAPSITDLLDIDQPDILAGIGMGYGKSGFMRTEALISLKRGKIRPMSLLRTNRKSHMRFRLVPNSTTLDDLS